MGSGGQHDDRERADVRFFSAAVVIVFSLALLGFLMWAGASITLCGGDGGSPYAEPGSTLDGFCNVQGPLIVISAGWLLAVGGTTYGAGRSSWTLIAVSAIVGLGVVVSPLFLGDVLSTEAVRLPLLR